MFNSRTHITPEDMKKKGTSPPIVKVVALALRHVMTTPYFLVKNFIWFRNSAS